MASPIAKKKKELGLWELVGAYLNKQKNIPQTLLGHRED